MLVKSEMVRLIRENQGVENQGVGENDHILRPPDLGTSKMSDLLEAQLLYQQSLDRRTDAFADYQNKLLEYRQATGQ